MNWKTHFTDGLVQIAILLSLFRTDWNNYFNSSVYDGYSEVNTVIMGPLSAYTQTDVHPIEWHNGVIGLSHPKAISLDYQSSIFHDIHSLSRYHQFDGVVGTEIDAFLVSDPPLPRLHTENAHISPDHVSTPSDTNNNHPQPIANNDTHAQEIPSPLVEGAVGPQENGESLRLAFDFAGELSKEDMDLVEILWRQDIDLGVNRDAYNISRILELEKERENELIQHREKEKQLEERQEKPSEEENITYITDPETGELIAVPRERELPAQPESCVLFTHSELESVEQQVRVPQLVSPYFVDQLPEQHLPESQPQHLLVQEEIRDGNGDVLSLDEAMEMLQQGVDDFSLDSQMAPPREGPIIHELNELEHMIRDEAELYENSTRMPELQHQASIEQRWDDLGALLPLVSENNTRESLHTMLQSYSNNTDPPLDSLLQNASLALQPNTSFSDRLIGFNVSDLSSSAAPNVNESEFSRLMSPESLGLNDTTLATSSSYVNSTETLLQQLLMRDDIIDVGLDNLNVTDMPEAVRLYDAEANDTSASAISSGDSDFLARTGSPNLLDLDDVQSNTSSPYDVLVGATGGSDVDGATGYSGTKHKYDTDLTYDQVNYGDSALHLNHSDGSNTSYTSNSSFTTLDHGDPRQVLHNHSYPLQPGQAPKARKTKLFKEDPELQDLQYTRDQKRAKSMGIPFTMAEMIHSSVDEFNEMLQEHGLTETQLQLMRDIRRRGKNKVAAQNCRKRKLEVIQALEEEVDKMRQERDQLRVQRRGLNKEMASVKQKYSHLYENVFRDLRNDQGDPYDPNAYALQQNDQGEMFLVPHNATSCVKDEHKNKSSRKRKRDSSGH